MRRFLIRWRACARGGAAVEFGLILPFLFVMHITVGEIVQAWQVRTRVFHVASAIADVTSQARGLTDGELADIMQAGDAMMRPYPVEPLGERITSLVADAQGAVAVDWSVSRNFPASPAPSVPSGYLAPHESIIVADAIYEYEPAFNLFLADSFRLRHTAYIRPRVSAKVDKR